MTILSIDIGGSKLKAALLDNDGKQTSERERVETPQPAPPKLVMPLLQQLAAKLPGYERISVGFPGSVRDGIVRTAPNLDTKAWAGFDFAKALQEQLGKPARVLNDASVQGLAAQSGNARFAWDSYRRLIQMFGKTVLDIDGEHFSEALDAKKADRNEKAAKRGRDKREAAAIAAGRETGQPGNPKLKKTKPARSG